jgi:hypothetical protein
MLSSLEQHKWVTNMLGYDYDFIYNKGIEDVVVYTLSRKYEEEGSLLDLSLHVSDWVTKAHQEWLENNIVVQLI